MNLRHVLAVIALSAATAIAASPATEPATQGADQLPSPADLIKQLKAKKQEEDSLIKIAYFDLDAAINEAPPAFAFLRDTHSQSLQDLLERLGKAKDDATIKGVLINLTGATVNLSQAQEIRDVLASFKAAKKPVYAYADEYETDTYTLATGASDICLMEGGQIMIPGVGLETQFFKGLFDKIGVQADFVQIGQYKGAKEPFVNTEPSEELRGELNKLVDALYAQVVNGIASHRGMTDDQVRQAIDETFLLGQAAKERGFVDHLVDQDGLRDLLAGAVGGKVNLVKDYAAEEKPEVDPTNMFSLLSAMMQKPAEPTKPVVALVPAEGVIVDGEVDFSLFGGSTGIGSTTMRRTFRSIDRDPHVKAVVVRINSPGGSALASEVMWQSLRRLAKDKPVIISVGSMAASGGYYLASAADTIYADPTAIVGSIGVVGGKFVLKGLFDKIGISDATFMRGKNADLFGSDTPWSDDQRLLVTKWMQQTYDQFTARVMTTRQGKIKDIDQVARGRIFLATQAKDNGMVDQIGGLQDAIVAAAAKAHLQPGQYDVQVRPEPKTLSDLLNGSDSEAKTPIAPSMQVAAESVLRMISPGERAGVIQQIQMLQLLAARPVTLAMPFSLQVK